ncbi:MAG TPA: DUF305 domain-containing protein [Bradyrhizobium sp.]|uniref:DUF305 domain-containing protein n=1 Tax=Bradyrhizobium sp. TaxID=376 RepID=UPI002D804EAE|nr:DUF305 domain-containing protein [Bradyrhizobium sp.]HET7884992.1 DUF305 domain-containing protein [Bradyrhizobium sp.]
MGDDRERDQIYMRHMTTHHAQGIELARLGVERASDPHLKALAALMVASQAGENRIFEAWWKRWFALAMPACSAQERADMPGYLTLAQMRQAQSASAGEFDGIFTHLMTIHHAGAVRMADEAWRGHGDPRLRIMAHAIRHEQQGEIALMRRTTGLAAVSDALRNMWADNVN